MRICPKTNSHAPSNSTYRWTCLLVFLNHFPISRRCTHLKVPHKFGRVNLARTLTHCTNPGARPSRLSHSQCKADNRLKKTTKQTYSILPSHLENRSYATMWKQSKSTRTCACSTRMRQTWFKISSKRRRDSKTSATVSTLTWFDISLLNFLKLF